MVAAKKALNKVSKKAAKSAFKKMIQGQSDDEDSDSEPEFCHTKRRRTVHLSHTEESSQEDDMAVQKPLLLRKPLLMNLLFHMMI